MAAERRGRFRRTRRGVPPDAGLGHPLLVLAIWLAGSLAVLCLVDLLHLAERCHLPERKAEIFATPGTVPIRTRIARRRAAPR